MASAMAQHVMVLARQNVQQRLEVLIVARGSTGEPEVQGFEPQLSDELPARFLLW